MSQWRYELDHSYRSAGVDDGGRRRRVRYQVTTNDPNAVEADVQQDSGYAWGDADPLDSTRYLRSIEVVRPDGNNPYLWELLLEYRSNVLEGLTPEQSQIPPLLRPPEFEWSFEEVEEQIDVDAFGNPIVTAAGEGYDPPLTIPLTDTVATVTFYRDAWDAVLFGSLVNCVNAGPWYGWPPETVRFCSPRARSVIEPPWPLCFLVTFTFKCRPRSWRRRMLHAGTIEWTGTYDAADNKVVRKIMDADGQPVDKPWPLDAEGRALKLTGIGTYDKPITFREFSILPQIDFAVFGV